MMSFSGLLANVPVENLSIFDPVSPPAEAIRNLFWFIMAISSVIALVVEGVLVYNLWQFRQSPTSKAGEPPQIYGSMPIEIAWTTAPALIVVVFSLLLIRTELEVRASPPTDPENGPEDALYVSVIGHQWWWEYRYDNYQRKKLSFITANELHIPAGEGKATRIFLTLRSADTVHSFWVPRLAGKLDLIPNRTNYLWFETKQQGLFLGQCGDFCGTQHANMLLRVYVDSPEDFGQWLANEQKDAVEPAAPDIVKGRVIFLGQSCINCHSVRGTRAKGTVGPDLTHLMSRKTLLTGLAPTDKARLRQWVMDPQSMKPGCLMPAFRLAERDMDLLVDYLTTLK
jgi:cytochrome c oxidase subunit 2